MTTLEYNKAVDKYADALYRFILKNLRDTEKSKDIIQDTFEKLWMNVQQIAFEKVKSYLFTVAYHTMIDLIRKDNRISAYNESLSPELTELNQYNDLQEVLDKALSQLPEIQKAVLLLRDYEGYSYEEIGQITNLNESQVKVYIYRARIFLKNYIGSLETVV